MEGVLVYKTGVTSLVVYPSEFAGTNQANAVVWDCGPDINAIVADLGAKGGLQSYTNRGFPTPCYPPCVKPFQKRSKPERAQDS